MTENKEKMLEIFIAKNLFAKDMSALAKTLGYASSGSRQGLYDAYNSKATVGQIEALWNRFEKLGYSGLFLYHLGQAYLDYQKLKKILGKDDIFHYLLKWWNGEYIDLTEFSVPKKEKIQEINLSESHEYLSVLLAFSFLGRESYDDFWKSDTRQMLNTFIKNVAQEYPEFRFLEFYFNTNVELLDSPAKFIYFIINILNETKNKRDSDFKVITYWDSITLWVTDYPVDVSDFTFYILIYRDVESYNSYVWLSCKVTRNKEYELKVIGFLAFMETPNNGDVVTLYKSKEERFISKYSIDNDRKLLELFFSEPITLHLVDIKKNSNDMYSKAWMYEIDKIVENEWDSIVNKINIFHQKFWNQSPKESSIQIKKVISDRNFIFINTYCEEFNNWYKLELEKYCWLKDVRHKNDVTIMEKEGRCFFKWKDHLYYLYLDECITTSQEEIMKEIFS